MSRIIIFALFTAPLFAQTAEISGLISDPSGLPVPNATLNVQKHATGVSRRVTSNQQGLYSAPALAPGSYDVTVQATGFASIHQNSIVLEVDQRAVLDFSLSIGSTTESVTVEGSAPLLNASDASVSTVIGNRFVENMPLNGRSFSSLIELAPGVVLTPANTYEQGQFSVNGQRPDANYFMVDGVSANLGNAGSGGLFYQGGAGQLPSTSAFGGTSNLVSLDALEEFRIRRRPMRRNMAVRQARRYRSSPSPERTNSMARPSNISATISSTPTIGSPSRADGEARTAAKRLRRRASADRSGRTGCSSSAL